MTIRTTLTSALCKHLHSGRSKLHVKQSKRCIPKNNLQGPQITVCQSS